MTATQTQLRRDTNTNLTAATPASGEPGWDTTNKRLVVGDGTTAGGIKCTMAKDHQNQTFVAGTVGGTGDAITLTNSPVVAAYAVNQRFTFKAGATNTGATTLNVDGLGAKNVKKMSNGALAALAANDIISGGMYDVMYDGTQFQIKAIAEGPYSSGALVYLGTQTASASAQLDFTSLMSSTYDDYVFVLDHIVPATSGADLYFRSSSSNGSSYDSSNGDYYYAYSKLVPSSTTASTQSLHGSTGSTTGTRVTLADTINNTEAMSGELRLYGVNNTSYVKRMKFDALYFDSSGGTGTNFRTVAGGGMRNSSSAINAGRFVMSSGNIASGNIKLYGIAKS